MYEQDMAEIERLKIIYDTKKEDKLKELFSKTI
jgi:hypothetical protein